MQPADELFERLIAEIREMAHRCLERERDGHTLETGDLMNEAYLALRDRSAGPFRDDRHFKAHVALCLRHILVDYARGKQTQKRGENPLRVSLPDDLISPGMPIDDILIIEEMLQRMAAIDPWRCGSSSTTGWADSRGPRRGWKRVGPRRRRGGWMCGSRRWRRGRGRRSTAVRERRTHSRVRRPQRPTASSAISSRINRW